MFLGKRVLDIVLSIILITILSPILLLVSILIIVDSKGGVIYKSIRVGTGLNHFSIYKFRTMYLGADKDIFKFHNLNQYKNSENNDPTFIKLKDDPRITKVGYFLRLTNIDELPQLFNILIGNMSFVGNRPLQIHEANNLLRSGNEIRFSAPMGLTGLWQIKKRCGGNMSDRERIKLDNFYALNYSFWFDLWIIFKTIPALYKKIDGN